LALASGIPRPHRAQHQGPDARTSPSTSIAATSSSREYKAQNPQAVVPTSDDGDGKLFQSVAILEYLEEKYPNSSILPKDLLARAWVRGFALINAADSHPLIVPRIRNYLTNVLKVDEAGRIAWIQHWLSAGLQAMEELLAEKTPTGKFCHGDSPTVCLIIIQPETVKRWRRNGWSGLWGYRSGGRWRGGRPRVSREVRELINRMAREDFLWGAPRIHGELLMLGCKVSQATVSRYLAIVHRSAGQSWRTFIRNQALAFRYRDDLEYSNQDWQSRPDCSYRANLTRSARQIARLDTGSRWLSQPRGTAAPPRLCARSASLRNFRYSTAPGRSSTAGANPVSVSVRMRGPPRHTTRFLKAGGSRNVCGPSFEKGQGETNASSGGF
jgi:maleylacetoacetate isomerase